MSIFIQAVLANALGGVLTAIISELIWKRNRPPKEKAGKTAKEQRVDDEPKESKGPGLRRLRFAVVAVGTALGLYLTHFTPVQLGDTIQVLLFGPPDLNERWTREAWRQLDHGHYADARSAAERVIAIFAADAREEQDALTKSGVASPPTGPDTVWRPWLTKEVFSRGRLNDVAASYWIAACADVKMGNKDRAAEALKAASALTYARIWDSKGWPVRGWSPFGFFWSPAQAAQHQLSNLGTDAARYCDTR